MPPADTISDAQTVPLRGLDGAGEELARTCERRIGEEAGEAERGGPVDLAGQRGGVARRRDAEAAVAGVALDEHAQFLPGPRGRLGEAGQDALVVHSHGHRHAFEQPREPRELGLADHVRRHEEVVEAGVGHCLGLAERLAGEARRAELQLTARDLGALVRLHVRAAREAELVAARLPAGEVPLHPVEVDDGRRCFQLELGHAPTRATASISTSNPAGSDTPTVVRAGYGSAKNSP